MNIYKVVKSPKIRNWWYLITPLRFTTKLYLLLNDKIHARHSIRILQRCDDLTQFLKSTRLLSQNLQRIETIYVFFVQHFSDVCFLNFEIILSWGNWIHTNNCGENWSNTEYIWQNFDRQLKNYIDRSQGYPSFGLLCKVAYPGWNLMVQSHP